MDSIFIEIARASYGVAFPEVEIPSQEDKTPTRGLNVAANGIHGALHHLENGGCIVASYEDLTDNQNEGKYSQ